MRDRRDYLIAGLAAALLFTGGLVLGQLSSGQPLLPAAAAQDSGSGGSGSGTIDPGNTVDGGGGITINTSPNTRPTGRTSAPTASDSNSNNRFVAVTTPVGSGESVLFLIDSETEHVTVYRYVRRKGLEFLAGRDIEYDLKIAGYNDRSKYSRNEMKRLFERERARAEAEALKAAKKK